MCINRMGFFLTFSYDDSATAVVIESQIENPNMLSAVFFLLWLGKII